MAAQFLSKFQLYLSDHPFYLRALLLNYHGSPALMDQR